MCPVAPPRGERGLKSKLADIALHIVAVAPPRGERGLKCFFASGTHVTRLRRSPSWGAWIEISSPASASSSGIRSLPLVGSVD